MSEDIASRIKTLITESELSVKAIANGAGVSKDKLWRVANGSTRIIDIRMADKVVTFLTGKGISL